MRRRKKKYLEPCHKIVARLSADAWRRAGRMRDKFGFKSIYEINQYLWEAFFRVADPDNETNTDPVPDEFVEMFYDLSNAEKHFQYVKPKRALSKREIDEFNGQMTLKFNENEEKKAY